MFHPRFTVIDITPLGDTRGPTRGLVPGGVLTDGGTPRSAPSRWRETRQRYRSYLGPPQVTVSLDGGWVDGQGTIDLTSPVSNSLSSLRGPVPFFLFRGPGGDTRTSHIRHGRPRLPPYKIWSGTGKDNGTFN